MTHAMARNKCYWDQMPLYTGLAGYTEAYELPHARMLWHI